MESSIQEAFFQAKKQYIAYDGVLGVGIGPKIRNNSIIAQSSIIVLVERKLSKDQISKGQFIPPEFKGFPVDIRVPRLMIYEEERHRADQVCIETDYEWIDFGKIHQIHLRQKSLNVKGGEKL